jgi:hypothetical protein
MAMASLKITVRLILKDKHYPHAQNTIYGGILANGTAGFSTHADTAYTSIMNSHTDTSYFSEPMG